MRNEICKETGNTKNVKNGNLRKTVCKDIFSLKRIIKILAKTVVNFTEISNFPKSYKLSFGGNPSSSTVYKSPSTQ